MTTTILARVRRVMRGHSDRALVVAVDGAGLEHKIEVPLEAVRDVGDGAEHVLMLSWSLHALPAILQPQAPVVSPATSASEPMPGAPATAAPASATAAASSARPSPSTVDQQFMALLSRGTSAPAGPVTAPSETPTARPEQQLAALLGLGRAPT